jgi:hypothetical protein
VAVELIVLKSAKKQHIPYPEQEEKMASNFTNFLVSLVNDPQKLDALKRDPDSVLDVASLTSVEKSLIKSGDMQKIRSAIVSDPELKVNFGADSNRSLPTKSSVCIFPTLRELST